MKCDNCDGYTGTGIRLGSKTVCPRCATELQLRDELASLREQVGTGMPHAVRECSQWWAQREAALQNEVNDLRAQLAAVTAERDEARKVIAKLPVTKDGVYVRRGDHLYHPYWSHEITVAHVSDYADTSVPLDDTKVEWLGRGWYDKPDVGWHEEFIEPVAKCYSTREAALAATRDGRGEGM